MRATTKAHIAVLLTNFFFATNLSLVKHISPSLIGPYGVNLFRVGIALLLFWLLWVFSKQEAGIDKKDIPRFVGCALTGVVINQMLFVKGLTITSTLHAALLMLTTPLLIGVLALWWLKEKFTIQKAVGLLLGIGGALLLILSRDARGIASVQGDLLILINAISYAIYFIMVKPLTSRYSPLHVIRWVFTFGFIMIVPFSWQDAVEANWQSAAVSQWLALGSVVLCGTFLTYSFNSYSLKHLGAATTGSYIYTQPLFAALIAALFLQEGFSIEKVLAGVLIFGGVFLGSRNKS
ncbi:MAG: DMT family transporter [Sphingomonadales bacterium]|nr:DMT family transporter [Sphingomonadales bacterium]